MDDLKFSSNCKTILSDMFTVDYTTSIETSVVKYYNVEHSTSCYSIGYNGDTINVGQCRGKLLYEIKIYSNPLYHTKSQRQVSKNITISIQ